MKPKLLFIIISAVFLISCEFTGVGQTDNVFYINNQDDFNRYSNFEFPLGSSVLFATGESFKGQFVIRGSGTKELPNRVAAYDRKSGVVFHDWIDNKPVINGLGTVSAPLYLYNGQFWEINNLEVTNTNGTKEDQGKLLGINVVAENTGLVEDIQIRNCYVHHVNGEVGGKKTGGIHVDIKGDKIKTKFQGLIIENNIVRDVGGVGISNQSSWGNINTESYYPWTDFVIRGNRVERTGRNGIIVRYAENPVVEYNIVAHSSRFDTGHSIYNFNTIGCIVQYNEAYGNTSDNPNDTDHGGFDADYNSRGTIIQYNYSHDNNWFCGIMRRGYNTDVTIRFNISQDELLGAYLYGFPKEKDVKDVKIYNNTHYFGKGKGNQIFVAAGKVRIPIETDFRNNIFCFEEEAAWGFEPDNTCLFENNLYYNLTPKGTNSITGSPLFVNPGTGGVNIDMRDPERLSGYRLQDNSPALNAGKIIPKNGGKNFVGNPLKSGSVNIGAW